MLVGKWFARRLNFAMGIYSVLVGVGFIAAFPSVGRAVLAYGWRPAWFAIGLAQAAVLAPIVWLLVRDHPEGQGLAIDGDQGTSEPGLADLTLWNALATPAFWVVALSSSLFGLVYSGISLFNQSILEERGFDAATFHQVLVIKNLIIGHARAMNKEGAGELIMLTLAALLMLASCANEQQPVISPCDQVMRIKVLPMKGEAVEDEAYNELRSKRSEVLTCLVEKVSDVTPMPDPRKAPRYSNVTVGDVAVFLLSDFTCASIEDILPEPVKLKYEEHGIYAYFEFVENPANRALIQKRWRDWLNDPSVKKVDCNSGAESQID